MSLAAFIIFLIVHVYVFHTVQIKRRFRTLLVISLFCLLLYAMFFYGAFRLGVYGKINSVIPWQIADILNGIFLYFFFLYFYAHLVIVFDRSVTVRIMVDIEQSKHKQLRLDEIKAGYSLEDKFRYEIEDMIFLKRIAKEGAYIKNTEQGKIHARLIKFLRDYLNIGGHQ